VDAVKIPVFEMRMPKDSGSDKEVDLVYEITSILGDKVSTRALDLTKLLMRNI
jgi:hypothetical protein